MSLEGANHRGVIAEIAALSVDHALTAIIRCPYTSRHDTIVSASVRLSTGGCRVDKTHFYFTFDLVLVVVVKLKRDCKVTDYYFLAIGIMSATAKGGRK